MGKMKQTVAYVSTYSVAQYYIDPKVKQCDDLILCMSWGRMSHSSAML